MQLDNRKWKTPFNTNYKGIKVTVTPLSGKLLLCVFHRESEVSLDEPGTPHEPLDQAAPGLFNKSAFKTPNTGHYENDRLS